MHEVDARHGNARLCRGARVRRPGDARAPRDRPACSSAGDDRGGVSGALSYRAHVVSPPKAHWRAVQMAFAQAHPEAVAGRPQGAARGDARRRALGAGEVRTPERRDRRRALQLERPRWLARSRRHPCALPGGAARGALRLAPDVLSDLVGQEGALARLSGGHAQLRHSRAHGERHDRVDERPAGLSRDPRHGGRSAADPTCGRRAGRARRRARRGAARCAVARRAREPGQPRGGLFRLVARERLVEEVIGVGEQAVARLDARHPGRVTARSRRRRRAASTTVTQLEAEYGVSRSSSQASSVLAASLQQSPQDEVHGHAELAPCRRARGRGC